MYKLNGLGGYILVAVFGILTGGIAVAALTRTVPEMMSRIMAKMMVQSFSECRSPEEM